MWEVSWKSGRFPMGGNGQSVFCLVIIIMTMIVIILMIIIMTIMIIIMMMIRPMVSSGWK